MNRVVFTGTENLQRIMREFPEGGYRKPLITAFRRAADPVKKAMKSNLPRALKGAAKTIRAVPYRGKDPELGVGVFGRGVLYVNRRGQKWNPWQLIYWHNYGTMANRSPLHRFANARTKKSANRSGGIRPGMFIEKAWDQSSAQAQRIFEEVSEKEIDKFFEKHAYKG